MSRRYRESYLAQAFAWAMLALSTNSGERNVEGTVATWMLVCLKRFSHASFSVSQKVTRRPCREIQ